MQPTAVLRQAAQAGVAAGAARVPMIRFLGKRQPPSFIGQTPRPHPMSPTADLPETFKTYRAKAQQHGPLAARTASSGAGTAAAASSATAAPTLAPGEVWDRSMLPRRFHRLAWTETEIEAIETGGASLVA
ncbi:hypothetical protein KEM52_002257 [Ascosphaera acerosa]|nr:hypothetical protein KEM52_002257 [Ascosphaera acerosa]